MLKLKSQGKSHQTKFPKQKDEGGLGLINLTERLQAIKILELLNAASQRPEIDNVIYEIGIKQMTIYGTSYLGSKAEETNDIIKLLEKNIDEINKFRISHKTTKPKDIQKIIFPRDKKNTLQKYMMQSSQSSYQQITSCYMACYPSGITGHAIYAVNMKIT